MPCFITMWSIRLPIWLQYVAILKSYMIHDGQWNMDPPIRPREKITVETVSFYRWAGWNLSWDAHGIIHVDKRLIIRRYWINWVQDCPRSKFSFINHIELIQFRRRDLWNWCSISYRIHRIFRIWQPAAFFYFPTWKKKFKSNETNSFGQALGYYRTKRRSYWDQTNKNFHIVF